MNFLGDLSNDEDSEERNEEPEESDIGQE